LVLCEKEKITGATNQPIKMSTLLKQSASSGNSPKSLGHYPAFLLKNPLNKPHSMNHLTDLAGLLLYIAFRIILLPVFIALDCFLGIWIAVKYINRLISTLMVRARQKRPSRSLQLKRDLVFTGAKFRSMQQKQIFN
jgi:hypothetical protein